MSRENETSKTSAAERPYPKVNFYKGRDRLEMIDLLVFWPIYLFLVILSTFLEIDWFFVGLFTFFTPIILLGGSYKALVYRNPGFLLVFLLWLAFALPAFAELGWFALDTSRPGWLLVLLLSSFILFVAFAPESLFQDSPLNYSPIIAAAEQNTDEYMNGYSPRPAQYKFPEFHRKRMLALARFLRQNLLLNGIREDEESITLFIPSSHWWRPFFWGERSYIRLFTEGKVELFVAAEDYNYLKVPISYHLLSQEMAKRLWKAYLYFEKDKRREALSQFRVRRKKTAYQKMKEEKERGEAS